MTAFRFVTLVCDRCFNSTMPGTALTEENARADAAVIGWTSPASGEDLCGGCSPRSAPDEDLGFGVPTLISSPWPLPPPQGWKA